MLAREGHDLAQQDAAGGPAFGDQLVTLCYGVIVAVAAGWGKQPFFASEAVFISQRPDR